MVSDINLNFVEEGSGETLILLHGNHEDSSLFSAQLQDLSDRYRVIAIDTRGHGKSPKGEKPFRLTTFADDLKNFMDSHKIQKAHILGFSDGGNIALLFAMKNPEMVSSLILNGANLYPSGMKLNVLLETYWDYFVQSFGSLFSEHYRSEREFTRLMVKEPQIKRDELKGLKIPTLVVVGTDDMIKESHSKSIAQSIPGAIFETLEGNHFIVYEKSPDFNILVGNFLDNL